MYHIWTLDNWEKNMDLTREGHRSGLRLRFDKGTDDEVRRACKEFAVFLRKEYFFPLRVRFLYKGIIIKHNKTEPTYTKTSLFLCEKRRFFMARTEKGVVATI